MIKGLTPEFEQNLLSQGYEAIIGIDEAGRGPWAGPVAIGAFAYTLNSPKLENIKDSKKLSSKNRAETFDAIRNSSKCIWRVELGDLNTINEKGIGFAIESSIAKIVSYFNSSSEFSSKKFKVIIDGYFKTKFDCDYELMAKADSKIYSVAAASIIAKETRDGIMREFAKQYPEYGFEKHMGYGTASHMKALTQHGPCPIHRTSFAPIKNMI